ERHAMTLQDRICPFGNIAIAIVESDTRKSPRGAAGVKAAMQLVEADELQLQPAQRDDDFLKELRCDCKRLAGLEYVRDRRSDMMQRQDQTRALTAPAQ